VADELQAEMLDEGLTAGERLPTESQLMERFDVSRTVVREATRLLVERGLVDVRPGRGAIVAELDGEPIHAYYLLLLRANRGTFDQFMELRLAFEPEISALAAANRQQLHLDDMLAAISKAAGHLDDQEVCLEADLEFHRAVAHATGNAFFALLMRPINECLRETYTTAFGYLAHQPFTVSEHRAIYDAIEARDAEEARAATRRHLKRVIQSAPELVGEPPASAGGEPARRAFGERAVRGGTT
jgi:DNA-binding FadR family transcriptional regulator